jgi:fucose permease
LLLLATAFLGAGFGLTVPVLNTFVAEFQPNRVDRAVLVLNALLGLGTALAPIFVAVFVGLGFWWGLPVLAAVLLFALLIVSARLPLAASTPTRMAPSQHAGSHIPSAFWPLAGFATLYGICETMNGNWSQSDMTAEHGATATQASIALTAFWAMVTVGRLLFASVGRWVPSRVVYHVLPFVLVGTFALVAALPQGHPRLGIVVFGLAGLACSALLPLTLSLGQAALPTMAEAVAGGVIAFYQVGYGLAAFGVGPIVDHGVSVSSVFGWTAIAAAGMGLLSFVVARHQPSPQHLHPRPSGHVAHVASARSEPGL